MQGLGSWSLSPIVYGRRDIHLPRAHALETYLIGSGDISGLGSDGEAVIHALQCDGMKD